MTVVSHLTKSNEALWWSLFSAGGVMAALFLPVMIFVTGFVLPFMMGDDIEAQRDRVVGLVTFWPVRLALFGVILLSFFHCAHRIRHVLMDFGLRWAGVALMICCYGAAAGGAVAAGLILVRL